MFCITLSYTHAFCFLPGWRQSLKLRAGIRGKYCVLFGSFMSYHIQNSIYSQEESFLHIFEWQLCVVLGHISLRPNTRVCKAQAREHNHACTFYFMHKKPVYDFGSAALSAACTCVSSQTAQESLNATLSSLHGRRCNGEFRTRRFSVGIAEC